MTDYVDFATASGAQVEAALGGRLAEIRLSRNWTQARLAEEAGVGERTVRRLEKGQGSSLDTLIRVMTALGLAQRLATLLPDVAIQPMERVTNEKPRRQRARPRPDASATDERPADWRWGDERSDG